MGIVFSNGHSTVLKKTTLKLYFVFCFFFINRYLKGCPSCRQQWLPSRPAYEVVTSFLQSLVPSPEPRYAMFGPGMEELDVSFVERLLHYPDVLPISGISHRQINGEDVCEASIFLSHALKTQMPCVSFMRKNTDCNKLSLWVPKSNYLSWILA